MTSRFLTVVFCAALAFVSGCGDDSPTAPILPFAPFSSTDIRVGAGAEAVTGRPLTVNYTGWIYDPARPESKGTQIDTSIGRAPLTVTLGNNQYIRGWEQGVPGMRVGGIRRLVIPPDLAYGSTGSGPVPPNATLVFDIELLSVQ